MIGVVGLSKEHWPAAFYCVVRVIFLNHYWAVEDWHQYCILEQMFHSSCPNVQSGLEITFPSYHQFIWRVVDTKSALKQLTSTGMAPGCPHIPLSFLLPPENFGHQIETQACGTISVVGSTLFTLRCLATPDVTSTKCKSLTHKWIFLAPAAVLTWGCLPVDRKEIQSWSLFEPSLVGNTIKHCNRRIRLINSDEQY